MSEASDNPPEQKKGPKKQRMLDLSQEDPEPETGLIHLRNFDAGQDSSAIAVKVIVVIT